MKVQQIKKTKQLARGSETWEWIKAEPTCTPPKAGTTKGAQIAKTGV